MAIIRATEEQVDRDFASIDEATAEQENLKSLIDEKTENTDNINFFQSMQDLGSSLVKNVPDIDNDLPNVVDFDVDNTTNTVVLAYELFKNPEKENDIIKRNNIKHPGFVVGGQTLEVLNNGDKSS